MADTPKLNPSDRSVEAYEKINQSIDHANNAKTASDNANTTADEAKQLDQVVIDGDSSVEAAQARVDTDGVSHQTLKERLDDEHTDVTTQLAERAIDVRNKFGTTSNSITQAVTESKTMGNTIELFPGTYSIDQTVIFDNVKVISHPGVMFEVVADVNGVQIGTNCDLIGKLEINTQTVVGYTQSACLITGGQGGEMGVDHMTIIEKIVMEGNPSEGVGLHVYSDSDLNFVDFVHTHAVFIRGFNEQLKLESVGTGWVNGNNFGNITMYQGDYNIVMSGERSSGGGCGGNTFNSIQIQASSNSIQALKASGIRHNIFNGLLIYDWDWQQLAIKLDDRCDRNYIITSTLPVTISDKGFYNYIRPLYRPFASRKRILPGNRDIPSYIPTDNFLAYADKKFTVTQTSGVEQPSLNSLFDSNGGSATRWSDLSSPVVLEIAFNRTIDNIDVVGLNFINGAIASNVKIETFATDWTTKLNITNNQKTQVFFEGTTNGVTSIRITLSGLENSETGNIDVEKIFAYSSHWDLDSMYTLKSGGDMYGDIDYTLGKGPIVTSPDGNKWRLTVDDTGSVVAEFI